MWMPGDTDRDRKLTRQCIAQTIDRTPDARALTPEGRSKAIDFAANIANTRNLNWGQLASIGIQHAKGENVR